MIDPKLSWGDVMRTDLVLGLPNGSMQKSTLDLLHRIGMEVRLPERASEASIEGIKLFGKVILMRPQDLPVALFRGKLDCAICGLDCVIERECESELSGDIGASLVRVNELNYGRATRQPVQVIIFGRTDSPPLNREDEPVRISSEYPNLTRKRYPSARVFFSHGSSEVKVATGLFDYGVSVFETGSSIEAHGLEIIDTLLVSPIVLVAREDMPEVRIFGDLLNGCLKAESNTLIKMNAQAAIKDDLIAALPALQSPTVNHLADGSYGVLRQLSARVNSWIS